MVHKFTDRYTHPVTEESVTTATPLMKHIMFLREFKPLEVEVLYFLSQSPQTCIYSEFAKLMGHPESEGTSIRKVILRLEKMGYVAISDGEQFGCRKRNCTFSVTAKFKRMWMQ